MTRLTDKDVRDAADLLISARRGEVELPHLPPGLTPEHTADVQRIIDAVSPRVGRPVRGWKAYSVHTPMQPFVVAPIYERFDSGADIPAELSPARLIEPEIMFRLDVDLPAREVNYPITEILQSVTAVVGFEVIGARFRSSPPTGRASAPGGGSLLGSLADHLANAAVVIGDDVPDWQDTGFEEVVLRVTEDGRELVSCVGCHPFDDPFLPVVVAVNRVRRRADLHAGDIIVTNSSTSILSVAMRSIVCATYEGLGRVEARFG